MPAILYPVNRAVDVPRRKIVVDQPQRDGHIARAGQLDRLVVGVLAGGAAPDGRAAANHRQRLGRGPGGRARVQRFIGLDLQPWDAELRQDLRLGGVHCMRDAHLERASDPSSRQCGDVRPQRIQSVLDPDRVPGYFPGAVARAQALGPAFRAGAALADSELPARELFQLPGQVEFGVEVERGFGAAGQTVGVGPVSVVVTPYRAQAEGDRLPTLGANSRRARGARSAKSDTCRRTESTSTHSGPTGWWRWGCGAVAPPSNVMLLQA